MDGHAVVNVVLGLNPMWVATCVLVATYAVIITEKVNRSIVALVGAGLMIVVGVLDQEEALERHRLEHHRAAYRDDDHGLDLAALGRVSVSSRSGRAQTARASPAGILVMLQLATAVFSAFLDNVTTVLLVAPVTLAITKELKVPPYPFLFGGDLRFQYRRHGDTDRRSAEHPDRLAGGPRLQRFRLPPEPGRRRGHAGPAGDDPRI